MRDLAKVDRLVAERIFGWKRMTNADAYGGYDADEDTGEEHEWNGKLAYDWFDADGKPVGHCAEDSGYAEDYEPRFAPASRIADAWVVVEKMRELGWWPCVNVIERRTPIQWHANFVQDRVHSDVWADTAPLAICLAALKALGVEVGDD